MDRSNRVCQCPNPARVSDYGCEFSARQLMLDTWEENRVENPSIRYEYLDDLVRVREAGFLDEYVVSYYGKSDWQVPVEVDVLVASPVRRSLLGGEDRREILAHLTAAEGIERYLHTKYVGQKRFSLEGGESLIPMLDDLIQHGGAKGIREIVIGMAHRGRINVLVNVLGKPPETLFDEFEGNYDLDELCLVMS